MNKPRLIISLAVLALLLMLATPQIQATPEHFGFRTEIMNLNMINLYGIGSYTHTERFDAEFLVYASPRALSLFFLADHKEYIAHFATFAFKYRPFVSEHFNLYVGGGSFPFIIRGYLLHATAGIEFMQTENFGIDLNMKYIVNKENDLFEWLPKGWALCLGIRL